MRGPGAADTLTLGCMHDSRAMTTPHFSQGSSNEIAFVFSCPGKDELAAGRPAAGRTGRNLARLLALVGPQLGLPRLERPEITVANAWPKVEYEEETGRTEAKITEVTTKDNIERMAAEIAHVERLIVFCGDRAWAASTELLRKDLIQAKEIGFCKHPGFQGLNHIRLDCDGAPIVKVGEQRRRGRPESRSVIGAENCAKRFEVVARDLVASIRPVTPRKVGISVG
jgi:uracil-DNA glycosylase